MINGLNSVAAPTDLPVLETMIQLRIKCSEKVLSIVKQENAIVGDVKLVLKLSATITNRSDVVARDEKEGLPGKVEKTMLQALCNAGLEFRLALAKFESLDAEAPESELLRDAMSEFLTREQDYEKKPWEVEPEVTLGDQSSFDLILAIFNAEVKKSQVKKWQRVRPISEAYADTTDKLAEKLSQITGGAGVHGERWLEGTTGEESFEDLYKLGHGKVDQIYDDAITKRRTALKEVTVLTCNRDPKDPPPRVPRTLQGTPKRAQGNLKDTQGISQGPRKDPKGNPRDPLGPDSRGPQGFSKGPQGSPTDFRGLSQGSLRDPRPLGVPQGPSKGPGSPKDF